MKGVHCLVCDKEIVIDDDEILQNGGYLKIEFDYGSKHDQGFDWIQNYKNTDHLKIHRILSCNHIRAYICDECFEQKIDKVEGYKKETIFNRVE